MVRIGVVGTGGIGGFHIDSLQSGKVKGAELTALCDVSEKRLAAYEGVEKFTSSEDMIRSGKIDAVLIATPHYLHTTIGIDALEQGLHVLVEKPISVHKADAERLLTAHKGSDRVFAIMLNQRTAPHFKRIKKLIDDGELGEIQRTNWTITNWFRSEIYFALGSWRATWKGEGGGVLINQCPHNLDLFQWFCGMPARVRAFCAFGRYHDIEVEDEVTAYLEYPNGATGVFVTSTGEHPGTNRLEIAGDRGNLVYEQGVLRFYRNETPTSVFSRETNNPFGTPDIWNVEVPAEGKGGQHLEIMQNFVDAIEKGKDLISPAKEGVNSIELANAMLYSSLIGDMVDFPLDAAAFEKKMQELIANSKPKKRVVEELSSDIKESFR